MGVIVRPRQVLLILAAISRYDFALDWALEEATQNWGKTALESCRFSFQSTAYYEPSMGPDLKKTFFAFEQLIDPEELAAIKNLTNQWEASYAEMAHREEPRPLNLDPGYITEAKLVLATTKDRDHRIYIGKGIYAEVTLYFHARQWCCRDWTYPDYRRTDYHEFFTKCRDYLRERYRE
jgi:hypothetical protein